MKHTARSFSRGFFGKIRQALDAIEGSPITLGSFSLAFLGIILVRLFIESTINAYGTESVRYMFFEFSHTFLFFLFAFLVFLPLARLAGASSWTRAANLILFGFLIIWTPPLIDAYIFRGSHFWSFYELDSLRGLLGQFFTFFDDTPNVGITYGVRVEVAVMTAAFALYAWIRSRKLWKTLGIALLTYFTFFILGTFPSYVALLMLGFQKGLLSVTEFDIVGSMLSPMSVFGQATLDARMSLGAKMSLVYAILSTLLLGSLLYRMSKKTFLALFHNVRFPQIIWHGGLFFFGGALAFIFTGARPDFDFFEILSILLLIIAIESAWLASVVANDIADINTDLLTNPKRPIPTGDIPKRHYATIGMLFFAASLLFSAVVSFKAMLLLLAYQGLAWVYSMPPLRLKRIPLLATMLAALAGISVLAVGYALVAIDADLTSVPLPILVFLFISYALTLPLKDFKDIQGDKADHVHTIPVLLGEERARLLIGSALFLSYAASPVVFHDANLIVPAIFFGTLAFMSVMRAQRKHHSFGTFRMLPAWNMLFITLYGICVSFILF